MPKLVADEDGIWAEPVEWTAAASAALSAKEYRYISPYFGHRKDGRVTRIFNAALTNRPELELKAAASQSDPDMMEDGDFMKTIATALGLAEGATEADVLSAVNALVGDRTAICSALGLAANAKVDEIRTAASQAGKVDPTKFVPISEFNALRVKVDGLDETRVAASVDAAIAAGKVTPAGREWALGYAKDNPEGFAKFVGFQPEIVGEGVEERRAAAIKGDTLTDEEKAACSMQGISEEDWIKSRKEMAA
jgi:phage I-like protein